MKNKIIIVGDSYTFGQGCSDREHYYNRKTKTWVGNSFEYDLPPSAHCWSALAQSDFPNFEFHNLSRPGNSNDNMFRQLVNKIDNHTALVIFAASFNDRQLVKMHNGELLAPWLVNGSGLMIDKTYPQSYIDAKISFITHLYTEEIGENTTLMSLLSAWALSVMNQSQFVWSTPCLDEVKFKIPECAAHLKNLEYESLNTYPFYKINVEDSLAIAIDGHASAYGHQQYYQHEIKPLLTRLLS
jgi:hypothetical protein